MSYSTSPSRVFTYASMPSGLAVTSGGSVENPGVKLGDFAATQKWVKSGSNLDLQQQASLRKHEINFIEVLMDNCLFRVKGW